MSKSSQLNMEACRDELRNVLHKYFPHIDVFSIEGFQRESEDTANIFITDGNLGDLDDLIYQKVRGIRNLIEQFARNVVDLSAQEALRPVVIGESYTKVQELLADIKKQHLRE